MAGGYLGESATPGWGRWQGVDGTEFDAPFELLPAPAAPVALPGLVPMAPGAVPLDHALPAAGVSIPPPPEPEPPPVVNPGMVAMQRPRGYEQRLDQTTEMQLKGLQDEAAARGEQARILSEGGQAAASQYGRDAQAVQTKRDGLNRRADQDMAALQRDWDEIAKERVDPGKIFADANAGQIIAAALGVAMSGYLNPRGENHAVGIIERMIDRSIAAQQANINNRRAGAEAKQGLLAANLQRWGNALDAELATKATMYNVVLDAVKAKAQGMESPIAKAQLDQQAASVLEKRDAIVFQLDQQRRAAAQAAAAAAGKPPQVDEKAVREQTKLEREQGIPQLGGWVAPTVDEAKEMRTLLSSHGTLQKLLDERVRLLRKYGSENLPGEAKAALEANGKQLLLVIKRGETLGTLDKGSIDFADGLFGSTSSWLEDPLTKAESFRGYSVDALRNRASSLGYDGEIPRYWEHVPGQSKDRLGPQDKRPGAPKAPEKIYQVGPDEGPAAPPISVAPPVSPVPGLAINPGGRLPVYTPPKRLGQ